MSPENKMIESMAPEEKMRKIMVIKEKMSEIMAAEEEMPEQSEAYSKDTTTELVVAGVMCMLGSVAAISALTAIKYNDMNALIGFIIKALGYFSFATYIIVSKIKQREDDETGKE